MEFCYFYNFLHVIHGGKLVGKSLNIYVIQLELHTFSTLEKETRDAGYCFLSCWHMFHMCIYLAFAVESDLRVFFYAWLSVVIYRWWNVCSTETHDYSMQEIVVIRVLFGTNGLFYGVYYKPGNIFYFIFLKLRLFYT